MVAHDSVVIFPTKLDQLSALNISCFGKFQEDLLNTCVYEGCKLASYAIYFPKNKRSNYTRFLSIMLIQDSGEKGPESSYNSVDGCR